MKTVKVLVAASMAAALLDVEAKLIQILSDLQVN